MRYIYFFILYAVFIFAKIHYIMFHYIFKLFKLIFYMHIKVCSSREIEINLM